MPSLFQPARSSQWEMRGDMSLRSGVIFGMGVWLTASCSQSIGHAAWLDNNDDTCNPPNGPEWSSQFGTGSHDLGRDIVVDSIGNVYITGWTLGTFPGQPVTAGWDAFLVKHNPEGEQLWAVQFSASSDDRGIGIDVDHENNVYIAGVTLGTFPGQQFTGGGSDGFLAKYTQHGQQVWVRQFGAGNSDQAYRSAVEATNSGVYVTGSTLGVFPGQQTLSSNRDAFLAKYTTDGDPLWVRQFGTVGGDSAPALGVDAQGNAYVAGYTTGPFAGQVFNGGVDAYLVKYSPNGTQLWLRQFGSAAETIATDVTVDQQGNIYVVGHTAAAMPGKTHIGGVDAFITKFRPSGEHLWTRQFGTTSEDRAYGVALNPNLPLVYVTGHTYGSLPGHSNSGGADVFYAVYTTDGVLLWFVQVGTGADDFARAITTPNADTPNPDTLYVAGRTLGSFPGWQNMGGQDALILMFPTCQPPEATTPGLGDLNGDGFVNGFDLLELLAAWGSCPELPQPPSNRPGGTAGTPIEDPCPADLNDDNAVDGFDLLILLANWGPVV